MLGEGMTQGPRFLPRAPSSFSVALLQGQEAGKPQGSAATRGSLDQARPLADWGRGPCSVAPGLSWGKKLGGRFRSRVEHRLPQSVTASFSPALKNRRFCSVLLLAGERRGLPRLGEPASLLSFTVQTVAEGGGAPHQQTCQFKV